MESLPVELITRICFLASTDGGFTGCALSLVSHHIHAASRPARFYSVLFNGPRVLTAVPRLLARLKEEHKETRQGDVVPRVRHLFVSVLPPKGESQTMILRVYRLTVSMLLRAVAPDVETLCITIAPSTSGDANTPIALDVEFPRLRELTVSGVLFSAPQLGLPPFLALRKLHVLRGPSLRSWTSLTPSITHLRISEVPDVHVIPVIWKTELERFYCACECLHANGDRSGLVNLSPRYAGEEPDEDPTTADHEQPYPSLQRVIVQPSPHTHFHQPEFYKRFIRELWETQPRARVPMYLVPADEDREGSPWNKSEFVRVKARDLWLAGVEGSERCWHADSRYSQFSRKGDELPPYLSRWSEESLTEEEAPPTQVEVDGLDSLCLGRR